MPNFFNINIIYKTTAPHYESAYKTLIKEHPDVNFNIEEEDFYNQVLSFVRKQKFKLFSFMTDDSVIFKTLQFNKINIDDDAACFSLRLGLNCNYSHPASKSYETKNVSNNNGVLKWRWDENEVDFAYPLSVDGHIFKKEFILKILERCPFTSPNTLEANLQHFLPIIGERFMHSFEESKLVSIPVNKVNDVFNNPYGKKISYSEKELVREYINGKRLDFVNMDFTDVNGPHQEIKFILK